MILHECKEKHVQECSPGISDNSHQKLGCDKLWYTHKMEPFLADENSWLRIHVSTHNLNIKC